MAWWTFLLNKSVSGPLNKLELNRQTRRKTNAEQKILTSQFEREKTTMKKKSKNKTKYNSINAIACRDLIETESDSVDNNR